MFTLQSKEHLVCLGPSLLAVYISSPWSGLGPLLYSLPTHLHHQLRVFPLPSWASPACSAVPPLWLGWTLSSAWRTAQRSLAGSKECRFYAVLYTTDIPSLLPTSDFPRGDSSRSCGLGIRHEFRFQLCCPLLYGLGKLLWLSELVFAHIWHSSTSYLLS